MKLSLPGIQFHLLPHQQHVLKNIEIFDTIDSTNTYLLRYLHATEMMPRICLAEMQIHGRGRGDHVWHSPESQNIYLSLLWKFPECIVDFHGLSELVGKKVIDVIKTLSLSQQPQLKLPNDIYVSGKKLAGILIESKGRYPKEMPVVLGLGLNVDWPMTHDDWISLKAVSETDISRNYLAAKLIGALMETAEQFGLMAQSR